MILDVTSSYDLLETKHDSTLHIDTRNLIVRINWVGKVDAETTSFLLSRALNELKEGNAVTLLIDNSQMDEISKGARLWIKEDFLIQRVKPISYLIKKVAVVKSTTSMGSIYSNLMVSSIKIVVPFLPLAEFQSEADAFFWSNND